MLRPDMFARAAAVGISSTSVSMCSVPCSRHFGPESPLSESGEGGPVTPSVGSQGLPRYLPISYHPLAFFSVPSVAGLPVTEAWEKEKSAWGPRGHSRTRLRRSSKDWEKRRTRRRPRSTTKTQDPVICICCDWAEAYPGVGCGKHNTIHKHTAYTDLGQSYLGEIILAKDLTICSCE